MSRRVNLVPAYRMVRSEIAPKQGTEIETSIRLTNQNRRLTKVQDPIDRNIVRGNLPFKSAIKAVPEQKTSQKIGRTTVSQFDQLKPPPRIREFSINKIPSRNQPKAKAQEAERLRQEELTRKLEQQKREEAERRRQQERLRQIARKRQQARLAEQRQKQRLLQVERRLEEQREQERKQLEQKRLEDERRKYLERQKEREQQLRKEKQQREREERLEKERKEREEKEKKEKQESQKKRELKIGLMGLSNIGNTCYLNATLQCLFNLPNFNDYFLSGKHLNDMRGNARVAEAYAKLISLVRNTVSSSQSPSSLKSAVASRNYQFGGYKQQDANEFLVCLLDLLGQDLKLDFTSRLTGQGSSVREKSLRKWEKHLERQHSHINSFFGGQYLSSIVCTSCRYTLDSFDPFWDVQLSFSKHKTTDDLVEMLDNFTQKQSLDGYQCEKCKDSSGCSRKIGFSRLPPVLIINLKRFQYDIEEKGVKIDNDVKFPINLSMQPYLVQGVHEPTQYNLVGYVRHTGQLDYGHYTATCRNTINNRWYHFNDSTVDEETSIAGQTHITSSEPYVLFYSRKS